jgi:phytanoyl-CoA hydroxylase
MEKTMLTADRIETFHREGYLLLENLFTDADLKPMIGQLNDEIDGRAKELVASGELSRSHSDEGFETRLASISRETDKIYWDIDSGRLSGPGIFSVLTHPKLLDVAESLVGPEIIASSVYRLRIKMPGFWHGTVPWHQDSGYFEPYCDRSLILTVWVPLVDANEENGCLQLIPRAHTAGVYRHVPNGEHRKYLEILKQDLPSSEILTVPVRKGGVLLMTNRTPHQSLPNRSNGIRWSADLRFQSAELPTNFKTEQGAVFREPGSADEPLACYPPEADFLVRSQKRPWDVVSDWRRFTEIRTRHEQRPVTTRWE